MKKLFSVVSITLLATVVIIAQEVTQTPVSHPVIGGGGVLEIPSVEASSGSSAATVVQPSVLPIVSQDLLRNYALSRSIRGVRWIASDSMDWSYPDSLTSVEVTGTGAEDILSRLFATNFRYRVKNKEDNIRGYVNLTDSEGITLFSGYAEYKPGTIDPSYNIGMQHVPILQNVNSAEVLAIDEMGETANRTNLEVTRGHALFQDWMAGSTNGIMVIKFNDGSMMTYRLSNPTPQAASVTQDRAGAFKIQGHYIITGSSDGSDSTVDIIETYLRPTVLLTVPVAQYVTFDVQGVYNNGSVSIERPNALRVTIPGHETPEDEEVVPLESNKPTRHLLNPGTYRLRFDWVNFGKPNTLYTGPMDGGKG